MFRSESRGETQCAVAYSLSAWPNYSILHTSLPLFSHDLPSLRETEEKFDRVRRHNITLRKGQSLCLMKIQNRISISTLILRSIRRGESEPLGDIRRLIPNQPPHGLMVFANHSPLLTVYILCVCKEKEKPKSI